MNWKYAVILMVFLSFFQGCNRRSQRVLDKAAAVALISKELNASKRDVPFTLGRDRTPMRADVLGRYGTWNVAVIYGAESDEGTVPVFSDRADYVLKLRPADEATLRKIFRSLDTGVFAPVVASVDFPKKAGEAKDTRLSFSVRHAMSATCEWHGDDGTLRRLDPQKKSENRYEFTHNLVEKLPSGAYEIRCSFENALPQESDARDIVLGSVGVEGSDAALNYTGGLKPLHCLPGQKLRFAAHFEPVSSVRNVVYYFDDDPLETERFECPFDEGRHELFALASGEDGVSARSRTVTITVDPLPDELLFEPSEHVHF